MSADGSDLRPTHSGPRRRARRRDPARFPSGIELAALVALCEEQGFTIGLLEDYLPPGW